MMSASIRPADDNERRYLFSRQVRFNANENLAVERSHRVLLPKTIPEKNIWKKKPPDFSVRLYKSLNLPRRSEESNIKERRTRDQNLTRQEMEVIRDTPPPRLRKSKEPGKFLTRFRLMEPFEANILYVKNGVYPKDKYRDPKPHDFRQHETDIPDFVTAYSRDPYNLKLKAQTLSSSCELPPIDAMKSREKVKRFVLHKPADPQWDSGLILPRSPWPPKSASYSRHRRRRRVYSAFMDRVEEKFTASNQENASSKKWLNRQSSNIGKNS
ncbi:uncharacterized protein C7orf78 homolog [Anomaloglossus baeobatrachus]|uniref:putative uncharacterized protein C7orf78 homolog n=1 Tax=Anomaloglossus baeobatrachus TaxID=238106 RepID=UPI003F4F6F4F